MPTSIIMEKELFFNLLAKINEDCGERVKSSSVT